MKATNSMIYQPIGIINSPFTDIKNMPIQPSGAKGVAGTVQLDPAYIEGCQDLAGFSHLILIYHFHRSQGYKLVVGY
ncbi:MAG: TrmO family methyltransferase [Desulfotomaculum sp.]|nr:TrmO family methyltransferase [Desulfotomaculum sp.]MCL0081107.1 TrmO family methyltransferase [Peptococcaceae bacterium]